MITFSQGGAAKIKSKQFSEFGSRTKKKAPDKIFKKDSDSSTALLSLYPRKRSSEMTPSSNNSSWSNSTNQCQHTKIGLRRCEKYRYTYCDEVVKWSNSSMISVNCSLTQARKDTILKTLEMTMKKNFGASEDCVKAARW